MSASRPLIALLRGINVGGRNSVPMAGLRSLLEDELGLEEVTTYIQSGNVLFRSRTPLVPRLPDALAARIEREHGLRIPVVLRTVAELASVARSNPFLPRAPTEELHVMFLAHEPASASFAGSWARNITWSSSVGARGRNGFDRATLASSATVRRTTGIRRPCSRSMRAASASGRRGTRALGARKSTFPLWM